MASKLSVFFAITAIIVCLGQFSRADFKEDYPMIASAIEALLENPEILKEKLADLDLPGTVNRLVKQLKQAAAEGKRGSCTTCKFAMPVIRRLATNKTFDDVRDQAVGLCSWLVRKSEGEGFQAEVMCNGLIDLYGTHVFRIIMSGVEPETICKNFNVCFNKRQTTVMSNQEELSPEVGFARHIAEISRTKRSAGNGDVIRIAQLADIHVDPEYAVGSPVDCGLPTCCRQGLEGNGSAWEYGTWTCNIPQRTLDSLLEQVADMKPDFVIYTGDNPPHQMWNNETLAKQLNCTGIVMDSLERTFPGYDVFPVMGNHEPHPTNLFYMGDDEYQLNESRIMTGEFARLWPKVANISTEQVDNIRTGAYYTMPTGVPGLRLIVLNTNFWYSFNFYNILADGSDVVENMKTFFEDSLSKAREAGEKVIVALHHPPGQADVITKHSQWYEDVINNYTDVIVLQIAGHTHNDHFKVFTSSTGSPSATLFVAPSVTARIENGGVNPSVRVFELDRDTMEVLDYKQYRMDLAANMTEMPKLNLAYTARNEYNLTDMSADSFSDLIDRIETNEEMYEIYHMNMQTNASREKGCDAKCKQSLICGMRHTSYEEVYDCTLKELPTTPAPTPEPTTGAPGVTDGNDDDDQTTDPNAAVSHAALTTRGGLCALALAVVFWTRRP